MAYDEGIAERIRERLAQREDVLDSQIVEKKMFGGLAFMVRGHMACGVVGDELMVRVGPERYEQTLAEEHARVMDFTGKPLRGLVYVEAEGIASDEDLDAWVGRALSFVLSLPPK